MLPVTLFTFLIVRTTVEEAVAYLGFTRWGFLKYCVVCGYARENVLTLTVATIYVHCSSGLDGLTIASYSVWKASSHSKPVTTLLEWKVVIVIHKEMGVGGGGVCCSTLSCSLNVPLEGYACII